MRPWRGFTPFLAGEAGVEESRAAWRTEVQTPALLPVRFGAWRGLRAGPAPPPAPALSCTQGEGLGAPDQFVQFGLDPSSLLPLAPCQPSSAKPLKD